MNFQSKLEQAWQDAIAPREVGAPSVISTFSGCGGSSLGYKMAGCDVKLAVEWDDHAAEMYRLNFPTTKLFHGDIAKLSVEEALEMAGLKAGELDIFDGSPPCQGFSMAGARDFNDARNHLFEEYCRLLKGLQPKVFVMENVKGMVTGKMKITFAACLRLLKDCGYDVGVRVINAAWYGVPQTRWRTIFIGVRKDLGIKPSHPEPTTREVSVKEAIANCPESEFYNEITEDRASFKYLDKMKPGETASKYDPKGHYFGLSRINLNEPSPTIIKTAGGLLHYSLPRTMNIAELKRLGSFPDSYKLSGAFSKQWARIGNSVPPLMMRAIAKHIRLNILNKISV